MCGYPVRTECGHACGGQDLQTRTGWCCGGRLFSEIRRVFMGIKKRVHRRPWFPALLERGRARPRRSAATQSHQAPPEHASSIETSRCWVVTTPPQKAGRKRHATGPRSVQRLPGLARDRYQDSTYLAVGPRAAWPHRRPDTAEGDPVAGSKMRFSPSSHPGTNWRRPSHS